MNANPLKSNFEIPIVGFMLLLAVVLAFTVVAFTVPADSVAAESVRNYIVLTSTTSTENSGLFEAILPKFISESGIAVRVVAKGTGQALRLARNGDADVVLVHHRASDDTFVAEGHGLQRWDVMYNDFLIVGPAPDPAGIREVTKASAAFARIAAKRVVFVSRGDESGTHRAETALWQQSGINPGRQSGGWYRETGSGMGATLNVAQAMLAYTLADRGTWLAFKNRKSLEILLQGDPMLFNPYGVILVNPVRHPHINETDARLFIGWLTGKKGQRAIAEFRVDGQQLFFPSAIPTR